MHNRPVFLKLPLLEVRVGDICELKGRWMLATSGRDCDLLFVDSHNNNEIRCTAGLDRGQMVSVIRGSSGMLVDLAMIVCDD